MRRTERRITARRQSCDQLGRLSSLTERLIKWTKLLAKLVIYIRSVTFPYIYNIYIYVCACILSYLKKNVYIIYTYPPTPAEEMGRAPGKKSSNTTTNTTTTNHHQPPPPQQQQHAAVLRYVFGSFQTLGTLCSRPCDISFLLCPAV